VIPARTLPSPIVVPKEQRAPGPDGMPAIVTPRDLDPLGDKDIITPADIEGLAKKEERRETKPQEPLIIPGK
jgi:hypothetical protein